MNPATWRIAPFSRAQWRVLVVALLAAAAPGVAESSFDYMRNGIQDGLAMSNADMVTLTLVPRIASLLVVFAAGIFLDALPWRRTLIGAAGVFLLGAAAVSAAGGFAMVVLGQSLAGIGGVVLGIGGLAMIGEAFEGPERAWAFGLWAAVGSAVYLVFPIAASWIALASGWRAVPILWALVGVTLGLVVARLAGGGAGAAPAGLGARLVAPLLAGVVLAAGVTAINTADDGAWTWVPCAATSVVALLALVGLRSGARGRVPPLDLRVLRGRGAVLVVAAILLAQAAMTLWYFTSVVLSRTYQLDDISIALVLVPVQLCGVLGGWLGGWTMRRIGAPLAAAVLLVPAGLASGFAVIVDPVTAVPAVVAWMAGWNLLAVAAVVPVTAAFMGFAPAGGKGAASSTRKAVSAIGVTAGAVVASLLVFASLGASVSSTLQERGVPQAQAEAVGAALRDGLRVADLPNVGDTSSTRLREALHSQGAVMLEGKDEAYATAGIFAMSADLLAALLMFGVWRRTRRAGPLDSGGAPE